MSRTTVISVRGRDRASLLADPGFVYVGRRCAGWPGSIWGNPFRPGMDDEDAIRVMDSIPAGDDRAGGGPIWGEADLGPSIDPVNWFAIYVLTRRSLFGRLAELRGKALGCWCCDWDGTGNPSKPCHAVALARLADATGTEPTP